MINDHGPSAFKIIPDWFQKALPRERGPWSVGGADRHSLEMAALSGDTPVAAAKWGWRRRDNAVAAGRPTLRV